MAQQMRLVIHQDSVRYRTVIEISSKVSTTQGDRNFTLGGGNAGVFSSRRAIMGSHRGETRPQRRGVVPRRGLWSGAAFARPGAAIRCHKSVWARRSGKSRRQSARDAPREACGHLQSVCEVRAGARHAGTPGVISVCQGLPVRRERRSAVFRPTPRLPCINSCAEPLLTPRRTANSVGPMPSARAYSATGFFDV